MEIFMPFLLILILGGFFFANCNNKLDTPW